MDTQSQSLQDPGEKIENVILDRFKSNTVLWKAHVKRARNLSKPGALIKCEAFENLAGMGDVIMPLIFREYRSRTTIPWGDLLQRITGIDFGSSSKEDLELIRDRWIKWGKEKSLIEKICS